MKTSAPTLADDIYRATFAVNRKGNCEIIFVDRPEQLRADLRAANKFVLDDDMSSFLVDLSSAAFMGRGRTKKSQRLTCRLVDQMRVMARLPHRLTWIEFNYRLASERARALGLMSPYENEDDKRTGAVRTERQGWLLDQHPNNECLFRVHTFENFIGYGLMMTPFSFAWYVDDQPSPWTGKVKPGHRGFVSAESEFVVGVAGYVNDRCGVVGPEYFSQWQSDTMMTAFNEYLKVQAGGLRRVWALLAAVNDIPVDAHTVVATKGFIGRGQYRKFLDHKTITLRIPDHTDRQKLARKIIAKARVRAHQVRGHWRKDHWHVGERIWVHEHVRGDVSLGFVMHDYVIEHPPKQAG